MTKLAIFGLICFLVGALSRGTWTLVHTPGDTSPQQTRITFDTQSVRGHESAPIRSEGKAELLE